MWRWYPLGEQLLCRRGRIISMRNRKGTTDEWRCSQQTNTWQIRNVLTSYPIPHWPHRHEASFLFLSFFPCSSHGTSNSIKDEIRYPGITTSPYSSLLICPLQRLHKSHGWAVVTSWGLVLDIYQLTNLVVPLLHFGNIICLYRVILYCQHSILSRP